MIKEFILFLIKVDLIDLSIESFIIKFSNFIFIKSHFQTKIDLVYGSDYRLK